MPVIESLSQRIIALCKDKDVQYSASIITNGYLLTKEVAEKLKEYHVRSAQITVDGPKEIHDTRRPMANGQGTYDVIMEHLVETKGILPINLRINVDYDNVAAADQVVETLREKDLLQSVHPYLGLVTTKTTSTSLKSAFPTSSIPRSISIFCSDSRFLWVLCIQFPRKTPVQQIFITAGLSTIRAPCTNAGMTSAFLKSPLATSTHLTTTFTGQI